MKANDFFTTIAKRTALDSDAELASQIAAMKNVELPDKLQEALDRLISIDAAKQNPDIANHYREKMSSETQKAHAAKLQSLGFTEAEIEATLKLDTPQILETTFKFAHARAMNEAGKTESEKEAEWKRAEAEYKARLDAEKKRNAEIIETSQRELKRDLDAVHTREFVKSAKIQTPLPDEEAQDLLHRRFLKEVESVGATLVFSATGKPQIRKADDPTAMVYKANGDPYDPQSLLNTAIGALNMRPTASNKPLPAAGKPGVIHERIMSGGSGNAWQSSYSQRMQEALERAQSAKSAAR